MLFVLWYKFDPEHTERVRELWKHFKFPESVKVIGRYVLIGRHMSVAMFDALQMKKRSLVIYVRK